MRPKQFSFLPKLRLNHGGDIDKNKRKIARPFSHKHAIHVVFRSVKARGTWSLLTRANERLVKQLLNTCAGRYHIKVYRFENVGNHLHLLIQTEARQYQTAKREFQGFLRQFAGEIAFRITGAKKSTPRGGFWEKRVYSRLVTWGREFRSLCDYFTKNFFESKGLWAGAQDGWITPWLESMIEAGIAVGVGPP